MATNFEFTEEEMKQIPDGLQPAQINSLFRRFQQRRDQIQSKIGEMDGQRKQTIMVSATLKQMDENKRCFRHLNGILFQRTAGSLVPELEKEHEKLCMVINTLNEEHRDLGKRTAMLCKKYDVVRGNPEGGPEN